MNAVWATSQFPSAHSPAWKDKEHLCSPVDPHLLQREEWFPAPFSIFVLFVMCLRLPSQSFQCSRVVLGAGTGCRLKHGHMCDWSETLCSSGVFMASSNINLFARMSSGRSVAAGIQVFQDKKGGM